MGCEHTYIKGSQDALSLVASVLILLEAVMFTSQVGSIHISWLASILLSGNFYICIIIGVNLV